MTPIQFIYWLKGIMARDGYLSYDDEDTIREMLDQVDLSEPKSPLEQIYGPNYSSDTTKINLHD